MSLADNEPVVFVVVTPQGQAAERVDASLTVLSFEYEEDEKKTDQLKLTIDNWDLTHFDNPIWREGNSVEVSWGYPGNMALTRECVVQKVEGSTTLTVTAQAKSLLMNRDVKSKTYENVTRSDVVKQIAKSYGYDDTHSFIETTTTKYEGISQMRQTDAQFVRRLADAEHFEFYIDFSGFHWHPRKMGQKPLRTMQYYLPPDVGDIKSFNVESDPFAKPTQVTVSGRDPVAKKDVGGDVDGKASDADTQRTVLVAPDTGLTSLAPVTTQTVERPTTETSTTQAKKEADGHFTKAQQATVKMTLDCIGDPTLIAKSVIAIRGISNRLSGLYYVNTASHKIDSGGYSMSLKVSTDGSNGAAADLLAAGATGTKTASKATVNPAKPDETKDPNETTPHVTVDPTTGGTAYRYSPDGTAPQEK